MKNKKEYVRIVKRNLIFQKWMQIILNLGAKMVKVQTQRIAKCSAYHVIEEDNIKFLKLVTPLNYKTTRNRLETMEIKIKKIYLFLL